MPFIVAHHSIFLSLIVQTAAPMSASPSSANPADLTTNIPTFGDVSTSDDVNAGDANPNFDSSEAKVVPVEPPTYTYAIAVQTCFVSPRTSGRSVTSLLLTFSERGCTYSVFISVFHLCC